jgi:hypothetical protein
MDRRKPRIKRMWGKAARELEDFTQQMRSQGIRVLVVGKTAYTSLGAFCFDPSERIPRMRSFLAFTCLEALQQATLWSRAANQ